MDKVISKKYSDKHFWFAYRLVNNKKQNIDLKKDKEDTFDYKTYFLNKKFITYFHNDNKKQNNIIIGQFLSSSWFQIKLDVNSDIIFYIIQTNNNVHSVDTVKTDFINNKSNSSIENIYSFYINSNSIQNIYNSIINNFITNEIKLQNNSYEISSVYNNPKYYSYISSICDNNTDMELSLHSIIYNDADDTNNYLLISVPTFKALSFSIT